jgi:hypothetical protein
MGPGTVCDRLVFLVLVRKWARFDGREIRCRKKMKRVERRGTLEQQQLNANALVRAGSHVVVQPPPDRVLQRTDTLLSHSQGQGSNGSQMSFRTVVSNPGSKSGRAMSPPPAIASLRDDDDNTGRTSRSSSRNGHRATVPTTATATTTPGSRPQGPLQQHLSVPGKRSPFASESASGDGKDPSPGGGRADVDGETDADADAEVDADAEGDGDHEEYEIDDDDDAGPPRPSNSKGGGRTAAVREADEELLEAVDAAEANSTGSHAGGRRYHDDD